LLQQNVIITKTFVE